MVAELKIMLTCHRSFSNSFWYEQPNPIWQDIFYCTFPIGKPLIVYNKVINDDQLLMVILSTDIVKLVSSSIISQALNM